MKSPKEKTSTADQTPTLAESQTLPIATLAATLVSACFTRQNSAALPDFSDQKHDHLFHSALRRSQWLLEKASKPDDDVHAYQIFQEGKDYSAEEIAAEFKSIEWSAKLHSTNTVSGLLKDIEKKMKCFPEAVSSQQDPVSESTKDAIARIREGFRKMATEDAIRQGFPSFDTSVNRFIQSLERREITCRAEVILEYGWFEFFRGWCYVRHSKGKRFRPHEIFRLASMLEWHPDRLITTESTLKSGYKPNPRIKVDAWFAAFEASVLDGRFNSLQSP